MIILFPFFPTDMVEVETWRTPSPDVPLALRLPLALGGMANAEVVLVGLQGGPAGPLLDQASALGLRVVACEEGGDEASPVWGLPLGSRRAVAALGDWAPDTSVALVDCRNAALEPDTVRDALTRYQDGNAGPLYAVFASEDHPVQLGAHFRFRGWDAAIRLSRKAGGGAVGAQTAPEAATKAEVRTAKTFGLPRPGAASSSRVFTMHWAYYRLMDARTGRVYVKLHHVRNPLYPSFVPYAALDRFDPELFRATGMYMYCGPTKARRLWDPATFGDGGTRIAGGSFYAPDHAPETLLVRHGDRLGLYRSEDAASDADCRVRVWPVRGRAILRDQVCDLLAGQGPEQETLHMAGRGYHGPLAWLPEDADGACYALLERVGAGPVDHVEPMRAGGGLWRFDPMLGRVVNLATGHAVAGRQDFPPVYEPDGSLAVMRLADVERFPDLLQQGAVHGFVLPWEQSVRVSTPFDLLRLQACTSWGGCR